MPARKHTHKYYKNPVDKWACALPDCSHFLPGNVEDSILNRTSICWECETRFALSERTLRINKPICEQCIKANTPQDELTEGIDAFLQAKGLS